MADTDNPTDLPVPGSEGANSGGLADEWRKFIGDPANRASLIQFGLQLAQPVALGQNTLGHIAGAVGAGGEAATRVRNQQRADEEAASKQDLRESQALAAESRASSAAARAGVAEQSAGLAREKFGMTQEMEKLKASVRLQTAYSSYVSRLRQTNANRSLAGEQPEPIPSFTEWISGNPRLAKDIASGGADSIPSGGGGGGGGTYDDAVRMLRSNRGAYRKFFDERYGAGAADRALGGE